jgi:hypothetical protein
MIDGAPEIFVALEQSGFSASIRQSPWIYPAANVGHIIFLVLFAGALGRWMYAIRAFQIPRRLKLVEKFRKFAMPSGVGISMACLMS